VRGLAGAGLALVLACAAAPRVEAGGDASLDEVNRRWGGARCRLLFDIPIKKSRDSEGWSGSKWIVPAKGRVVRKGQTASQILVSDRSLVPGGVLRTGTMLVADGWFFDNPERQVGLTLRLRGEDSPLRVRMTFYGLFYKSMGLDDLGPIEQWARLDIFAVSAADERLDDVASPPAETTGGVPVRSSGPQEAPPLAPAGTGRVEATVLGVTAEPLKVAAGAQVVLVVTYEVRGLEPGLPVEVSERRVILRGGEVLTTLEATVTRQAGIHRSTQSLVVPAGLAPGVLELRATVAAGGAEGSGRTLFEVTTR
jgi:hypothetical protein